MAGLPQYIMWILIRRSIKKTKNIPTMYHVHVDIMSVIWLRTQSQADLPICLHVREYFAHLFHKPGAQERFEYTKNCNQTPTYCLTYSQQKYMYLQCFCTRPSSYTRHSSGKNKSLKAQVLKMKCFPKLWAPTVTWYSSFNTSCEYMY